MKTRDSAPARVPRARFLGYLFRPAHVVVILGVMGAVQLCEHFGWLDGANAALLDSFYILTQRDIASKVAIVDITEDDYRLWFHETSPLDPRLLSNLVDTIAEFHPAVIGVDIDTSAAVFQSLEPRPGRPPVVWAIGARQRPASESAGTEPDLTLEPVLGRPWTESVAAGLSVFLLDADHTLRRYSRSYVVSAPQGPRRAFEALPAAIARAAAGEWQGEGQGEASRPVLIRFPRPPSVAARIPASFVLHAWSEHSANPGQPWPLLLDLFRGRAVLIGGTYSAARDSLATPYGPMSGVDVVAAAVATELAGGGMDEVERAVMILLDAALAVLLVYFGYALSVRMMLIGGAAAIVAATVFSFVAFSTGFFWLNTVPLLAAVLLHQWAHRVAERRHCHDAVKTSAPVAEPQLAEAAAGDVPAKPQAEPARSKSRGE
jgi:CHASE2 domain-containing sensor protein